MNTENIAINRYLGTTGVDELSEVISSAYKAIEELRGAQIPSGLTAYDVADAILDTFNGHASSGFNVNASELVDFVCTAVEQLSGDASDDEATTNSRCTPSVGEVRANYAIAMSSDDASRVAQHQSDFDQVIASTKAVALREVAAELEAIPPKLRGQYVAHIRWRAESLEPTL